MASLLESLGQVLTPETMTSLGNALGLDPEMTQQGVNVVGPLVQGGLANTASSPQGLDSLMQVLTPPADGASAGAATGEADEIGSMLSSVGGQDMINNVMGMVTGHGASGSNDPISMMLSGVFGSGAMAGITAQLDKSLGFKVSTMIPIIAPLLIGTLRKMTQEQNMDPAAVATMLQEEQKTFIASGSKEATLVQDAMKAGQEAMALKGKFTPEEWTKVRIVPMAASALVIHSAPSNAVGVGHEIGASMQALADGRSQADPVSLCNIAFDSPFSDAEKLIVQKQTSKEKLLSTVKEGASIVAKNDPNGMAAYRQIILSVATAAAEATKEGGLLGYGAKRVNKSEQATLNEIAAVFSA